MWRRVVPSPHAQRTAESPEERRRRTAPARATMTRKAALRAIDDPVKLERAARIVRVALERRRLELADVLSDGDRDSAA